MDCEMLEKCGFFKKYEQNRILACKGFVSMYCKGEMQKECKRKEYRQKNGCPPDDNMMPNGSIMK